MLSPGALLEIVSFAASLLRHSWFLLVTQVMTKNFQNINQNSKCLFDLKIIDILTIVTKIEYFQIFDYFNDLEIQC